MNVAYTKQLKVAIEKDLIVVGGGPAGFAAAVSAARNGADVLLVERTATLGGMATSGLVGPFMTSFAMDEKEQLVRGIFDELVRRMERRGSAIHPSKVRDRSPYCSYGDCSHANTTPFLSEDLAFMMDEMLAEAGAQCLFYTQVADVVAAQDGAVEYLILNGKEGLFAAKAKVYIDCTGDADVAAFAGVPCIYGNGKGFAQPASLFFEVGNIDRNRYLADIAEHIYEGGSFSWRVREAKQNGDWTLNRDYIGNYEQPTHGRYKINCSRVVGVDATNSHALTKAHIAGRKQVQEIAAAMRKYIPGCEEMQLLQVASSLGVRESRHIVGRYTLTVEDMQSSTVFEDAICSCAYALDIHQEDASSIFVMLDNPYSIPYRCLLPQNCDNLLVAGRCISGTSDAAGSYRVMPCCFALGEAAGAAAALALKDGVSPAEINVRTLQQTLLAQGAYIKGISQ
ncbi:MAG: FAD-dependent oxidoreductase [Clostridia bacterium]|nr:FAD-dependent oxidoreductase [Clostridia bacterium]